MKQALLNTRKKWLKTETRISAGQLHSQLSSDWIENLAGLLRDKYTLDKGYRVFSRGWPGNKSTFRTNEYLYDLTVIKVGVVPSANGKKSLEYPAETEWHIESEFCASDSRASIVDFGKLLMSAAKRKCMVLPANERIQAWAKSHLCDLKGPSSQPIKFAFVPHPKHWLLPTEPTIYFPDE